ncbi:glutathione hydrolase 7-like [Daphnia pulex]|uniref:glutathione hydrolase 7-like n=1 Tax=Daphnia pulex TaxID=6669 RepID=UPI001EDD4CBE|nr:glutathione hydrolase 7-like [Daphnia pulex]
METIPLSPTHKKARFGNCCSGQQNDGLRVIIFCFGVLCICVTIALVISIYLGDPEILPRGAVATDSQQCSQIGVDTLQKGGNAIDAAVAAMFCMCVVNPHITSLGGGGAMIILNHLTSKPPMVINFQDAAPGPVNASLIVNGQGPLAVGIPGLLSGLWESHKKFGKLKWADLLQPSIQLSNLGINVSSQLAGAVQGIPSDSPLRRSQLFFPNNIPLAEGQVIRQPAFGKLLDSLAQNENGAEEFYKGKSGMKLVNFMAKAGADWTMEELGKYRAREETAITGTYGKTTLYTSSAPTSGPQLISLLNILSGFQLSVRDYLTLGYTHDMIETMRVTQNQVSKLGDPLFGKDVASVVAQMTNKTLADEVRKQIHPNVILPNSDVPSMPEPAASVVSVIDNEEIYVAVVSGLNSVFGAHLVTPDGYVLNNAMASFYDDPSLPDNVGGQAGQRPLQGLLPVIATETNGRCGTRFVTGSADATLLAQVVMNLLQFNQSAADAIRSARIHSKPQSSSLELEDMPQAKLPEILINSLTQMGHTILLRPPPYPSVNLVLKSGDALSSQSDGRGGGYAVKYGP